MRKSDWIDVSVPLYDRMVHWPGDPPVEIRRVQEIARGDSHTLSAISLGSHSGTHIDAPAHLLKGGTTVDRIPLSSLVGRARVLEVKDAESIKVSDLVQHNIRRGERLLFKTRNSTLWRSGKFAENFVYISPEAAEYLAVRRLKLVGVDYLSVGAYKKGGSAQHKALLNAGICIVEGLNLAHAAPGNYHFICLPLRLENGDGAPARAIIKPYRV